MFKTTIDLDAAVSGIASIVQRFGYNHVATAKGGCQYVESAQGRLVPVCIVGQYFADLGILRATLTNTGLDQHGACVIDSPVWHNAEQMGVTFTEQARLYLRFVQGAQDSGEQWGNAAFSGLSSLNDLLAQEQEDARKKKFAMLRASLPVGGDDEPLAAWERELLGNPE